MEKLNFLLVDDDKLTRALLKSYLAKWGFDSIEAGNGREGLNLLKTNSVDLIISDQEMPDMGGLELLEHVKSSYPGVSFIMLTGHGSINNGVSSIKNGADDYVLKPFNPEDMLARIKRIVDYRCLAEENKKLKNHLQDLHSFQNIITRSPAMKEAVTLAEKVSKSPATTVCVIGESGTGKEVMARAIHFAGDNMENCFVAINCAAIPATLLESELFGHVKGAFTGATENRNGKFDLAQGGTILLDEIGDMPLDIQAKLLRVLQERVYERIGSGEQIKANFRVITATHRDIKKMADEGAFRQDLYHRITPFPIFLPPLRERKEDIPALANLFMDQLRKELGKPLPGVSKQAMNALQNCQWPGNIRELRNCLERAAILCDNSPITPQLLNISASEAPDFQTVSNKDKINISLDTDNFSLDYAVDQVMEAALKMCNYNKTQAAKLLKVNRKIFYKQK